MDFGGARYIPDVLTPKEQHELVSELREILAAAPLVRYVTPSGRPMSVRMSSAGQFGWVSDAQGYRYADRHPSGNPWPPIPERVLAVWSELVPNARLPECCLINWYDGQARMGLHQDKDEVDLTQPVLSISLGDSAQFRMGGAQRGGPTRSVWLHSGDVMILAGPSRLSFHGIDRVKFQSSKLLPNGGRINLTLRVVR